MRNLILKFKNYRLKKRYEIFLQDRIQLSDYEKKQLIPEIKSRLKVLIEYFQNIISICERQRGSRFFMENLDSIINPLGLTSPQGNTQSLGQRFFDEVMNQAQTENIDDINRILREYECVENTGELGLFLNSKLIAFWLRTKGKMQGSAYQVDKGPLLEIPLFAVDEVQQKEIVDLVDRILAAKKNNLNADTTAIENKIDELFYKLYDLTEEEIGIIEGSVK